MSDETRVTLYRWREGNDRFMWHVARGGPVKAGRPAPSEDEAEVQEFVPARALEEARAALEFYADDRNYVGDEWPTAAHEDHGQRARAVLAVLSGGVREGRGSDG